MSETDDWGLVLRAKLQRLPREVEPERDLWEGVRSGILAPALRKDPAMRRAVSVRWAIAASVASVGVGVLITLAMQKSRAPEIQAVVTPATYSFVPASTDAVRSQLRRACAAQLARLPPATREKVEKDLLLIKNAVADIQTALVKDPGNALLQDLLVTTYQNELDTLANVQALARSTHSEVSI